MNQLLTVGIPLLIFAITVILLIVWFLRTDLKRKQIELLDSYHKAVLPNRLQAYERIALFLERISPESLILREQNINLNCLLFHSILLKSIRSEYEHNVAMQIYLTPKTWYLVVTAKDEIIKLINTTAREVNPELPSMEMGKAILERANGDCRFHLRAALEAIQQEVHKLG